MSVFNKTSDASIIDTFKNVFQRKSSEVFKSDVPEFRTIQKYMLHYQYSVTLCTYWLVLSRKYVRVCQARVDNFQPVVMSCMRVCRKQALSRVKYYYYATISKIQQATIMTV